MRLARPLCLLLALAAAGCAEAPLQPSSPEAPNLARWVRSAGSFGPFEVTACSGEKVVLDGTVEVRSLAAVDAGSSGFRVDTRGTGVGAESGVRYRFSDSYRFTGRLNDDGSYSTLDIGRTRLIAQGSAPDLHAQVLFRIRVDAQGQVTTDVSRTGQRCT